MQCVVAGAGYVGLTTALVLVERGHSVTVVDIDESRAQRISSGEVPFVEPGVDAALKAALRTGRFATGTDLMLATATAEVVFVCVGTPSRPAGDADLSYVKEAAKSIGQGIRKSTRPPVVVVKSTVPPGTTRDLVGPTVAQASRSQTGRGFELASNPEFLREGSALTDARTPDRVVLGVETPGAAARLRPLLEIPGVPYVVTDATTAELIKYASNAFLAVKVSFANEMASLSSSLGVDVYDVMRGVGLDRRVGPEFLRAGAGFGGSCFPKDLRALDRFSRKQGHPLRLPKAALEINEAQAAKVVALLEEALGGLRGKSVALLGLAFKPETDDVRETRALPMYQALVSGGAKVVCWDPRAGPGFQRLAGAGVVLAPDLRAALRGRDAALIQTEWKEIRDLPPAEWKSLLGAGLVVDGRRSVDANALHEAGVRYVAIGAKNP